MYGYRGQERIAGLAPLQPRRPQRLGEQRRVQREATVRGVA